jgi:hypothetical protein
MRVSKEEFRAVGRMSVDELADRARQLQKILNNECESEKHGVAMLAVIFQFIDLMIAGCTYEEGLEHLNYLNRGWEKYHKKGAAK